MNAKALWNCYLSDHIEDKEKTYEAWSYFDDELADLSANGIKTATASAFPLYAHEKCPLPKVGDLSIILYQDASAQCIIQTTSVKVVPFDEVSAEHAYKEGEGDRSLAYWRMGHEHFFTKELAEINEVFTEKMLVVCEEFKVVYSVGRK